MPSSFSYLAYLSHSIIAALLFLAIYAAYLYDPILYVHLIAEDNWGENLTAFNYLVAAALFSYAIIRSKKIIAPLYLILLILLALAGLEELSWGQRIFSIDTPDQLKTFNHKGELNLHNTIATTKKLDYMGWILFLWYAVIPACCLFSQRIRGVFDRLNAPLPALYLMPVFCLGSFFFISHPLVKWDEIGELLISIGFLFYATDSLLKTMSSNGLALQKYSLIIFSLLVPAFFSGLLIQQYFDGELFLYRSNLLIKGYSSKGLCTQADELLVALDKLSLSHRGKEKYPQMRPSTLFVKHAVILDRLGEYERADSLLTKNIAAIKESLKTENDNPTLWQDLGNAYSYMGDKETARQYIEKAIERIKASKLKKITQSELDFANLKLVELYQLINKKNKAKMIKAEIRKNPSNAMIKKHLYLIESNNSDKVSRKKILNAKLLKKTVRRKNNIYTFKPLGNCLQNDTIPLSEIIRLPFIHSSF